MGRVFHGSMPEPAMNYLEVNTGSEHMHGDAMFQHMEVTFCARQLSEIPIGLHQPVQTSPADSFPVWAEEEGGAFIFPALQILTEGADFICLKGMMVLGAATQAADG